MKGMDRYCELGESSVYLFAFLSPARLYCVCALDYNTSLSGHEYSCMYCRPDLSIDLPDRDCSQFLSMHRAMFLIFYHICITYNFVSVYSSGRYLQEAGALCPTSPEANQSLCHLRTVQGRYEEAKAALKQVATLLSQSTWVYIVATIMCVYTYTCIRCIYIQMQDVRHVSIHLYSLNCM